MTSEHDERLTVLSILGNDYTLKVAPAQESALLAANALLKTTLADTKRKYPTLIGEKLLVLAALNLCSQQVDLKEAHRQELARLQEKIDATVEVIESTIKQG